MSASVLLVCVCVCVCVRLNQTWSLGFDSTQRLTLSAELVNLTQTLTRITSKSALSALSALPHTSVARAALDIARSDITKVIFFSHPFVLHLHTRRRDFANAENFLLLPTAGTYVLYVCP